MQLAASDRPCSATGISYSPPRSAEVRSGSGTESPQSLPGINVEIGSVPEKQDRREVSSGVGATWDARRRACFTGTYPGREGGGYMAVRVFRVLVPVVVNLEAGS